MSIEIIREYMRAKNIDRLYMVPVLSNQWNDSAFVVPPVHLLSKDRSFCLSNHSLDFSDPEVNCTIIELRRFRRGATDKQTREIAAEVARRHGADQMIRFYVVDEYPWDHPQGMRPEWAAKQVHRSMAEDEDDPNLKTLLQLTLT